MHSRTERLIGHIGTETRPKLLRETAVRNIRQWGEPWTSNAAWVMTVLWIVKLCCLERTVRRGNASYLTVPFKKATANYVPAAAVIRRWRALSGIIGRKEHVGGFLSLEWKCGAQPRMALDTGRLECRRGKGNSQCSGEMRRYWEEHQWRRRLSGLCLTLRCESQGSERD